jgi:hypothetical protein
MREITQKEIEEYKQIYKKEYGKEITDEEAREAGQNLVRFAEILYEQMKIDHFRKERLKKEPRGFHLTDGMYNCLICHQTIENEQTWYDKNGIKCVSCQKALNDKVIPQYVCKNRDSWCADWELKDKLGIHPATVRKMVREKKLKARTIYDENGRIHFQLFILKENPIIQTSS